MTRNTLRLQNTSSKTSFFKWEKKYSSFKYPYPQNWQNRPHKLITGYGDWSSFAGLYRLWAVTGEDEFRTLGVRLLKAAILSADYISSKN